MSGQDELFEPGMLVLNPLHPEWGLGQVQSSIPGRVTVMFEQVGKIVVDTSVVSLRVEYNL